MSDKDKLFERIKAEEAGQETGKIGQIGHLEKVIPIRLTAKQWVQIKKEANKMSIGASTLARIWIVESLRKLTNGPSIRE